ncbi:MAG: urea transporter, partial [Marinilabiliales bacterium]|nr:urea transporter [Marinilabiliales bacterium]
MSRNNKKSWIIEEFLPALLNSYAVIFFLKNRWLAVGLMLLTFINFYGGLSGLIAVTASILLAYNLGFDKEQIRSGVYGFNSLLLGLGMGTFFDPGAVYFFLLLLGLLLTLILSVTLGGWLGKAGLPHLSIPFVLGFWMILLPSATFENLGLTHRNIYWINEAYSVGGNQLVHFMQTIDSLSINQMADAYCRSLSSIFFQDHVLTGLIIALLLLMSSRIIFSLTVIGFLAAYCFALFTGSDTTGFSHYNIGANYIMTAIAVGGFFLIPSGRSYLWSVLLVPVTSLVLLFLTKLFGTLQLPVFSLPFSIVVILFVYFLKLRRQPARPSLTPIQLYAPEQNLYSFQNNSLRLAQLVYFPLHLPFWGKWVVSQGYDGQFTHKGDFRHAYDFMLLDEEMKSFTSTGLLCEHYHCYGKPVVSPADGIVEEVIDKFPDNEIGKVDTLNNWGNTLVIRHSTGLYTQLSHLRKGSFKVGKGDLVKQGDILAQCGNSGRSHQPHLHFQVQGSPVPGSRTLPYPFAYYRKNAGTEELFCSFSQPQEGDQIMDVRSQSIPGKAFELQPNTLLKFRFRDSSGEEKEAKWEAFTDAYNYRYLYCAESRSTAYYVNDGTMFYFTGFYGDKNSLLFYFYLSAYKVLLDGSESMAIRDELPLHTHYHKNGWILLNDFIAPFLNKIGFSTGFFYFY